MYPFTAPSLMAEYYFIAWMYKNILSIGNIGCFLVKTSQRNRPFLELFWDGTSYTTLISC